MSIEGSGATVAEILTDVPPLIELETGLYSAREDLLCALAGKLGVENFAKDHAETGEPEPSDPHNSAFQTYVSKVGEVTYARTLLSLPEGLNPDEDDNILIMRNLALEESVKDVLCLTLKEEAEAREVFYRTVTENAGHPIGISRELVRAGWHKPMTFSGYSEERVRTGWDEAHTRISVIRGLRGARRVYAPAVLAGLNKSEARHYTQAQVHRAEEIVASKFIVKT